MVPAPDNRIKFFLFQVLQLHNARRQLGQYGEEEGGECLSKEYMLILLSTNDQCRQKLKESRFAPSIKALAALLK